MVVERITYIYICIHIRVFRCISVPRLIFGNSEYVNVRSIFSAVKRKYYNIFTNCYFHALATNICRYGQRFIACINFFFCFFVWNIDKTVSVRDLRARRRRTTRHRSRTKNGSDQRLSSRLTLLFAWLISVKRKTNFNHLPERLDCFLRRTDW